MNYLCIIPVTQTYDHSQVLSKYPFPKWTFFPIFSVFAVFVKDETVSFRAKHYILRVVATGHTYISPIYPS